MSTPRLHLLMLTYGALPATQRCIRSLQATVAAPFDLWVVDNGSTDGTREWLAAQPQPWLHVRHNATNRGVPGGRNDLVTFASPHAAADDWFVFIDNDLEFQPGWLDAFLAAMRTYPAATVFGKVGHFLHVHADGRTLLPAPWHTARVDAVSGGFACFVRVAAMQRIGPFDERLGRFWHEDDDFCVRALQCGFDVVAVPEAGILHHEHASGVAVPGLAEGGSRTNQTYLAEKWRAAGWVDRDGWIVRPAGDYLVPAVRDVLRARLGRAAPIGRTELAAAMRVLDAVIDAAEPAAWLVANRQPLPECLWALIALHRENAAAEGHGDLVAQLDRITSDLPRVANGTLLQPRVVPQPVATPAVVGQGVCEPGDFADPLLLQIADELQLGAICRDPHAHDRGAWEQLAVLRHLQEARLAPGSQVRRWGKPLPVVEAWLAKRGCVVEDGAAATAPCAAVLVHRCLEPDVVAQAVAGLDDAALVVLLGDVVLNGVPAPEVPQPAQLALDLCERAGLAPVAPIRRAVTGAVLEACVDRPGRGAQRPFLSELLGPQLLTSFVVAARRVPVAAPRPAVLVPAAAPSAPQMRVGVDLRTLFVADSTARGIGKYTAHHLQALLASAPGLALVGYTLGGDERLPAALQRPGVSLRRIDDYRPEQVDLLHVPDPLNLAFGFDSPLRVLRHPRTTVLFHDLTPFHHYIEYWPRRNREAYLDRLRQLEHSDCQLLTNSVFTAEDALQQLRIPRQRVTPVLAGLHHGNRPRPAAERIAAVAAELGIRGPFVLHVGALDPHKNFFVALQAFLRVRSRHPLQLVVVGAVDPGIARAAAVVAEKRVPDVVFTGYLPRGHLDALYAGAAGLLFLSRAEGFGFPILEAMAAGCPVIASHATSHPEVAGDAAVLVAPDDAVGAAAALERLLTDPAFAADLRQRGERRARAFPWSAVAERTLRVWRAMLGGGAVAAASAAQPALAPA